MDSTVVQLFTHANVGSDGSTEYTWRNRLSISRRKKGESNELPVSEAERKVREQVAQNFRVYFPTYNTVAHSKAGTRVSGLRELMSTALRD